MLGAALTAAPAAAQDWSIDWWTVDAGGVQVATGGDWALSGTIGQTDATAAHVSNGGPWQLTGGFWAVTAADTDYLFADGFEG